MLARLGLCLGMLLACRCCPAGHWKPVAVVSFSGWANLQSDLDFLGQLAQIPALPETLGTALAARTGVEGLDGLDVRRPWGAIVQTDGLRMTPIAFVPVSDAGLLLRSLVPLADEPREELPGVWKIGHQTLTGFVREADGWAFVAQTAEALQELPDPTAALGELPARYRLAVSLYPANVPEALRTLVIDEARGQKQLLLDGGANGEPLPAPLAALPYESIEEFFTVIRRLTLGCTLDVHEKRALLELSIVPLPESRAAKRWSQPWRMAGSPGVGGDRASLSLELRGRPAAADYSVLSTQYPVLPLVHGSRGTHVAPPAETGHRLR